MSCVKVVETHGGTSGTEYMYVLRDGKLYHISQLPGVRPIKREEWGRSRTLVEWCVPTNVIEGSEGVWVSFSKGSRYCSDYYFRLPDKLEGIEDLSLGEMSRRGFVDDSFKEPLKALSVRGVMFELFGPEIDQLRIYEVEVPKLVNEFWSEVRSMGINNVYAAGHAERTVEMLYELRHAELISMALPTPQGRVRSLHEKNTRAVELYILAKVLKALYELGFRPTSNTLRVEFATNRPAIVLRSSKGIYVHVFYQAAIVPHIISGFVPNIPKPFHAVPDIALVVSDREERVGWLADVANEVALIVEVKYDLSSQTVYERPDTTINQVETYRSLLRGVPKTVVVVYKNNPGVVHELRARGIECFDGVSPDNSGRVEEFVELIKRVVREKL